MSFRFNQQHYIQTGEFMPQEEILRIIDTLKNFRVTVFKSHGRN